MTSSATRLAREVAKRSRSTPERVARAAAKELEKSLRLQLARDTGGDRKLSGMGNRTISNATTVFTGSGRIVEASVGPRRARGAWTILDKGTRGHSVAARRLRRSRSQAMRIGDSWATGPWRVSGSRAKHTFDKGVAAGLPAARRAAADELSRALRL